MPDMLVVFALLAVVFVGKAEAATITVASCNQADVQAGVNSAVDADTVQVPVGTCTWTTPGLHLSSVSVTKAITLMGAGIDQTIINDSTGGNFDEEMLHISGNVRVTGFTFTGMPYRNAAEAALKTSGTNWRVDHNKFHPNLATFPQVGRGFEASGIGIIDHNAFIDTRQGVNIQGSGDASWSSPSILGTANNVFIEDNTFTYSAPLDGAYDAYGGANYVFRYNTVTGTNIGHHGLDSGGYRSPHNFEVYGNTLTNSGAHIFAAMNFRGGTGVTFNNTINATGGSYDAFAIIRNYRSDSGYVSSWGPCDGTNPIDGNTVGGQGYPCKDQIGRTTGQALDPLYGWNNTHKGSAAPTFTVAAYNDPTRAQQYHILEHRDFYNNVPKPGYVPYTYPHPLVSGSPTPPPPPSPTPPPPPPYAQSAYYTQSSYYSQSGYYGQSAYTPPPPPPANKFAIGDRVVVATRKLNVRSTPAGKNIGFHKQNDQGTVIGSPTFANGYTWWSINYDAAPDGWSAQDWLEKAPGVVSGATTTSIEQQIQTLQLQFADLQRQLDALLVR